MRIRNGTLLKLCQLVSARYERGAMIGGAKSCRHLSGLHGVRAAPRVALFQDTIALLPDIILWPETRSRPECPNLVPTCGGPVQFELGQGDQDFGATKASTV